GHLDQINFLALRSEPLHVQLNRPKEPPTSAPHFVMHLRQWLTAWAAEEGHKLNTDGLIIHATLDDDLQQAATEVVARQAGALQNIADVEWSQRTAQAQYESPAIYANLRKKIQPFSQFWKTN